MQDTVGLKEGLKGLTSVLTSAVGEEDFRCSVELSANHVIVIFKGGKCFLFG